MAQHDYVISNGTGAAVRSDLNNALLAIVSQNSGATEPTTTYAYQWWADTTTGLLKIRNSANNAWITLRELDGTLTVEDGTVSAPGLAFRDDLNTGIWRPGTDQFAISTNGVERVEWGTSEVVFNDGGNNYDFRVEGDTNANLLFVDASADAVGIGTSSPGYPLHVAGRISYTSAIGEGADTTLSSSSTTLIVGESATWQNLALRTNGNSRLYINSSGNVGIGSTSPQQLLHVDSGSGGANAAITLRATGYSGNQFNFYAQVTPEVISVIESTERAIAFKANGSERARIDSSGRLLVGTSTARANYFNSTLTAGLQIEGTGGSTARAGLSVVNNDSVNNPAYIVLGRSGAASLGSNTVVSNNDWLGTVSFQGADGTELVEAASITAYVDATPGANDMPGRLVFSTTADGASSPTERMRITNVGSVGIGATPSANNERLKVYRSDSNLRVVDFENGRNVSGDELVRLNLGSNCNNTSSYHLIATTGGTDKYYLFGNGTYATSSDQRLKKNIETTRDGYLKDLCNLRVVKYNWNEQDDGDPKELGLIAQELEQVFPGLVQEGPANEEGQTYKSIKSSVLPFMLLKALQESTARIEALEAEVAALKAQ